MSMEIIDLALSIALPQICKGAYSLFAVLKQMDTRQKMLLQ